MASSMKINCLSKLGLASVGLGLCSTVLSSSGALVAETLDLSFNSTGSTGGTFGTTGAGLLNDTFVYDALNVVNSPDLTGSGPDSIANTYQIRPTALTSYTLNYDITTYTIGENIGSLYVDLWTTGTPGSFATTTFTFYDASDALVGSVDILADQSVPGGSSSAARYGRAVLGGLEFGDTISRLAVTFETDTQADLAEIRVAAVVPEPSSIALCLVGAGVIAFRRQRTLA